MTPKELVKAHNGDPLAAVDGLGLIEMAKKTPTLLNITLLDAYLHPRTLTALAVEVTIAHLGEDGAEKWGRALLHVLTIAERDHPHTWNINRLITRIANATDRERLAACLVALAERE